MPSWPATCAPWSAQRIAAGEEPEQVRAWLVERYGNWVSYRPPVEPVTWPLWAAPILLLLAGAWLLRKRLVQEARMSGLLSLGAARAGDARRCCGC